MKLLFLKLYMSLSNISNYMSFWISFFKFRKMNDRRFELKFSGIKPCIHDNTSNTNFDTHYVYHPAWAARVVKKINPPLHIDISSTLHFCSMLSAFIPTQFYDYRPANISLTGLKSSSADLNNLFFEDKSIESISCMHTIEHIGLGRYGDPIDPFADIKAINELKRVTKSNGNILFVVPVGGKPRIEFNAHRIYTYSQIIEFFSDCELKNFSLVPNTYKDINFIENATQEQSNAQTYGCGCFWFIKK